MKSYKFEEEFAKRHPGRLQLLRYMHEAIGVDMLSWSDLTTLNLSRIKEYIKNRVSPNTCCTYLAILKAFLTLYTEEELIPCKNPAQELKCRRVPSQHIALTMNEIIKFDLYTPKTETESDVKNLFMRGCLTGMRLSDAILLTEDNIIGNTLCYVSQKTSIEVKQPVHSRLMKYVKEKPKKQHQRSVVNRTIQKICKELGFCEEVQLYVNGQIRKGYKYEFITMHSSRRSYVTCLATNGVPIAMISKLAGHSGTAMTDRYICFDSRNPGKEAMDFFNR